MRVVKILGAAIGLLLLAPVLALLGAIVVSLFVSGFSPVDPDDPGRAAVAAVLTRDDGSELCRSLPLAELAAHRDTLDVRLSLDAGDRERCTRDFAAYSGRDGWPVRLAERERRYEAMGFRVEGSSSDPSFVVAAFSGDAVFLMTRYRLDDSGEPVDVEVRSAGPGNGVFAVVVGGAAGLVVWGILVVFLVARRRGRPGPAGP